MWFFFFFMIFRVWILWFNYYVILSMLKLIVIKYLDWRGCIWYLSNEWDLKWDENEVVFYLGNNVEDCVF